MAKTTKKVIKKTAPKKSINLTQKGKGIVNKIAKFKYKEWFISFYTKYKNVINKIGIAILFVISFTLVDLFVQYLNTDYSVAIVNGVRISQKSFEKEFDIQFEREVSEFKQQTYIYLVLRELIMQEAAKKGVTIEDQEIKAEVDSYYKGLGEGGRETVLAELKKKGLDEDYVYNNAEFSIIYKKLIAEKSNISDEDLLSYFNENKSEIYGTKKVKFEDEKENIKNLYIQNIIEPAWYAELEANSNVKNNLTEEGRYGFLKTTIDIVKLLYSKIQSSVTK